MLLQACHSRPGGKSRPRAATPGLRDLGELLGQVLSNSWRAGNACCGAVLNARLPGCDQDPQSGTGGRKPLQGRGKGAPGAQCWNTFKTKQNKTLPGCVRQEILSSGDFRRLAQRQASKGRTGQGVRNLGAQEDLPLCDGMTLQVPAM